MDGFTDWQRSASYEALKMSLEAVKEWLPRATKVRKTSSNEEEVLTDETREKYFQDVEAALSTLSSLNKETFDIVDMFKGGHAHVLHNVLEFYGEYMSAMLGFVGHMYRYAYKEIAGMFPEEAIEVLKKNNEVETK